MRGIGAGVFIVGGLGIARGFVLEAIKQLVQVVPVKNQARPLLHGHQLRAPHLIERAAAHAHVVHGFLVGQAAFEHVVSPFGNA